jgi:glycosyltransferase involved in cell wall biosynthesis
MAIKRALVCSPTMPEHDREGGSRRIFQLIGFLRQFGWAVSFVAENAMNGERYARALQQMGVATYASRNPWNDSAECLISPETLISTGHFDLVFVAFWRHAEQYLPLVRSLSPHSKFVIDSIDLHFLRESRNTFCKETGERSSEMLDAQYADEMVRELNIYAAADAVITVSEKEADLIKDLVGLPDLVYFVPLTDDFSMSPLRFADRKGLLFVGNFRHPPNTLAVEYLCREIVPKMEAKILSEHPIYIVGNGLNQTVASFATGLENVLMVGWVPSVMPYFERSRISLIPLLYGAGTKTKLMQSLMVGTPSVSTTIGIEGFDLRDRVHVLVADQPQKFADSAMALLTDEELWQGLVSRGREHIVSRHGTTAVRERFHSVISRS